MRQRLLSAALVLAAVVAVWSARVATLGQFAPALAAEAPPATATASSDGGLRAVAFRPAADPLPEAQPATAADRVATEPVAVPEATTTPAEPPAAVVAASAPPTRTGTAAPTRPAAQLAPPAQRTVAPTPAVTAAPVLPAPAPVVTAAPTPSCAAGSWFCYPRLGISGAIVPYADCSGSTDVGSQIRSFACLSEHYLMAHAYTQFGKITGWRAGDVVIAYGRTFTVSGAFVQSACTQPRLPLAPLSLQTSLSASPCGEVLIVQAR